MRRIVAEDNDVGAAIGNNRLGRCKGRRAASGVAESARPRPSADGHDLGRSRRRRDHSREEKPARAREKPPAGAGNGHVKLFVNRGARSGISEDNLRWALTEGAVIPAEAIGDIRVLERFSFVDLPDEQAKLELERLDGTKLEGKQIRVEYAKD